MDEKERSEKIAEFKSIIDYWCDLWESDEDLDLADCFSCEKNIRRSKEGLKEIMSPEEYLELDEKYSSEYE